MPLSTIPAADWYETIAFADGVTLVHEPWIAPYFRCNMWHVRGRDRDLLIDAGLGVVPLRPHVPFPTGRPIVLVASHTHFDHIGAAHEFDERLAHAAEAAVLAAPTREATAFTPYGRDDAATREAMFLGLPPGWSAAAYEVPPAPVSGLLADGDRVDLGRRVLTVLHTPGHSPGHLCLFEEATGILFAQDAVYDGPLVDDIPGCDVAAYRATMRRLRTLAPSIVHGGHFASFGPTRLRQLIDAYLAATG